MPCRMLSPLLNECHLVDFFEGCDAVAYFCQCGVSQERHALVTCGALDLRSRPAADDHFTDPIGEDQQLRNGAAAPKSRAGALDASCALDELHLAPLDRIEARGAQYIRAVADDFLAVRANYAHQALS